MEKYNRNSNLQVDRTSREILVTMYNPPDKSKSQPWTSVLLENLGKRRGVALPIILKALKVLFESELVIMRDSGFDLTEAGKREAIRLGAKYAMFF